jgi:hypothetical protein
VCNSIPVFSILFCDKEITSNISVDIKSPFLYHTLKVQFCIHCTYRYKGTNIQAYMIHSIHFLIHQHCQHSFGPVKTLISVMWLYRKFNLCFIKHPIIWGVEVHLHIFLIWALDVGQWYLHTAAIVSLRVTSQIAHWIEIGWAFRDSEKIGKIQVPCPCLESSPITVFPPAL